MTSPTGSSTDPREALDEAIRLVVGAGNGWTTRSRPIEEWQRLGRLFAEARAALAAQADTASSEAPDLRWYVEASVERLGDVIESFRATGPEPNALTDVVALLNDGLAGKPAGLTAKTVIPPYTNIPTIARYATYIGPNDSGASPEAEGLDGAGLIAAERRRQITEEGYTAEHDADHGDDLALAGATYAIPDFAGRRVTHGRFVFWPWDTRYWKPTPNDRTRELVKAGALIAAAIDARLAAATESRHG